MSSRLFFNLGFLAVAIAVVYWLSAGPYNTRLPFGSTDLSSVQEQLSKLPEEERALVEAYVKRSNGDVLPAAMADPDAPLTARTFGAAIKLQRNWNAKMAERAKENERLIAERDVRFTPLRAIARARVVQADIMSASAYAQSKSGPHAPQRAANPREDERMIFVVRIRLENLSDEPIAELEGSLAARDNQSRLPLKLCYVDTGGPQDEIPAHGHIEIRCPSINRYARPAEYAFANDPADRFQTVWEPHRIKLANGREFKVDPY